MFNLTSFASALCITVALIVGALPIASAADATQSLGRSIEKLKDKNKLTIGYFGGSITAGAGASDASKTSWRALTTAWFKEQFPKATITEINAAIGGTGSDLGAFRCQVDLMNKDPDLVFIEFAVNDGASTESRVKRSMEGIVRQILLANPWAEIVFVYTTAKELCPPYAKGEIPQAVGWHQTIARHYGIPEINVGRALAEQIARGNGSWETLTSDGVHPNDAGYALYMKSIAGFLESRRHDRAAPPLITVPDPLTEDPLSGGHIESATAQQAAGWKKEERLPGGRSSRYLTSSEPGTELVHQFSGSTIGVQWLIAFDGGDIEWTIDEGEPKRLSSWDKQALQSNRESYAILADNLSAGEHTLRIKILGEKNPLSRGTWIRIAAFLVHCAC